MANVEHLLGPYLGRQRWFAGQEPDKVVVVDEEEIVDGLHWMVVDADGCRYQVVVGLRSAHHPPDFLHGHDDALLGTVDDMLAFDATLDPEYAKALLHRLLPDEHVEHIRPMGVEQSNTSLVCDDRLVLKLFRRLPGGPNPDVAVPAALAAAGFTHIAEPVATWTYEDDHLAVVQPFLAGGAEGWALALASLRDLYAADCDPAEAGGDFAAEAWRLGEITARMHVAMAAAFGTSPADRDAWLDSMRRQLDRVPDIDAGPVLDRVADADADADVGCALRVHGDYHLAQVLRTDAGWFVLDFEGEPARPLEERTAPSSPYKDVAGMLRSFHYAAHVALAERDELQQAEVAPLADAWEAHNRAAFLEGYANVPEVGPLLPAADDARCDLLAVFELDKAVYEVLYERAHRPEWERIPRAAIRRLLGG